MIGTSLSVWGTGFGVVVAAALSFTASLLRVAWYQSADATTRAFLALAGLGFAVFGIVVAEFKPTAVGLVLILGSGVFATLKWVPFDDHFRTAVT